MSSLQEPSVDSILPAPIILSHNSSATTNTSSIQINGNGPTPETKITLKVPDGSEIELSIMIKYKPPAVTAISPQPVKGREGVKAFPSMTDKKEEELEHSPVKRKSLKGKGKEASEKTLRDVSEQKQAIQDARSGSKKLEQTQLEKFPNLPNLSSVSDTTPFPVTISNARIISNISNIQYPEGVMYPTSDLNLNAQPGKFRYDRDFLLQFKSVCTEKPNMVSPETLGLKPWPSTRIHHTQQSPLRTEGDQLLGSNVSQHPTIADFNNLIVPPLPESNPYSISNVTVSSPVLATSTTPTAFIPKAKPKITLKAPDGTRINLENLANRNASTSDASTSRSNTRASKQRNGSVRLETEDQRNKRLEAERKERESLLGEADGRPGNTNEEQERFYRQFIQELMLICGAKPDTLPDAIAESDGNLQQYHSPEATEARDIDNSDSCVQESIQYPDLGSSETTVWNCKFLLDKLNAGNFDNVSDEIISWINKLDNNEEPFVKIVHFVVDKATEDSTQSDIYAILCRKIVERVNGKVQDSSIRGVKGQAMSGGKLFRRYLLDKCQKDFDQVLAKERPCKAGSTFEVINDHKKVNKSETLGFEGYDAAKKPKSPGLLKFIGELFKQQMVTKRIVHTCTSELLDSSIILQDEIAEGVYNLLFTVGAVMDNSKTRAHMDVYFSKMNELTENPSMTTHGKSLFNDLRLLRSRKWQPELDGKDTTHN